MSRYSKDNANYELFGVINHEGNPYGGHYFSFVKRDNQWFMFNDNQIQKIDTFIHPSNYCLFYRKINKNKYKMSLDISVNSTDYLPQFIQIYFINHLILLRYLIFCY